MRSSLISLGLALAACSSKGPTSPAPVASACPTSLEGSPANCEVGKRCEVGDGVCLCQGHDGGEPPDPGVDYSHWRCGRTRHRTDGCPDTLVAGGACTTTRPCSSIESMCYDPFACRDGHWVGPDSSLCPKVP